jgi:peptidoglycan/LPS O-acetylase OafA/YrhL
MKPELIFLVSAALSYLAGYLLWPLIDKAIRDKKYRKALRHEQERELDKYRKLFIENGYAVND